MTATIGSSSAETAFRSRAGATSCCPWGCSGVFRVDGRLGARGLNVTKTLYWTKFGQRPSYHLYIDDRPVHLLGTGLSGVKSLVPDGGGVDLIGRDGAKTPYCATAVVP